jgi:hypothetical protein
MNSSAFLKEEASRSSSMLQLLAVNGRLTTGLTLNGQTEIAIGAQQSSLSNYGRRARAAEAA